MITIKDVARRAGVSVATVSRVINNSAHPVNNETRRRVMAAIEDLGFYPNAMARSLQFNETRTIGLMLPDIANPYYPGIVRGVEDVAQDVGYTVILCNTDRSKERTQRYLRVLREKRVDGIVFTGGGVVEEANRERFFETQVPAVVIGRHPFPLKAVQIDNVHAAKAAVQFLLSKGHRRIATITGPTTSTTVQDRLSGYRLALAEGGLKPEEAWTVEGDFTPAGGYTALVRLPWRDRQKRPTAIFAQNDLMAIGIMKALKDLGLKVPEDVAVVGFDDIPLASYAAPALTTVAVPVYDLGVAAMRVLTELFAGRGADPVTLLETRLVVRDST
ncbi:MAG: LacI family DNA-binding transcriptional regulator [Syntrophothermus sp.]